MLKTISILALCGPLLAQSIAITSPATGATVSGPTTFAISCTSCPSLARVEYRLNGMRLQGEGTWASSHSSIAPYSLTYNVSYQWDGTHQLTAIALDALGNTIATSAAINLVVNDRNLGTIALASPNPAVTQSGTISVSVTSSIVPSGNAAIQAIVAAGYFKCSWDGKEIFANYDIGFHTQTFSFDTTSVADGVHDLNCYMLTLDSGLGNSGTQPVVGIERQITTLNTTALRELRLNYSTVYLWLGGTTTATLVPRTVNCAGTEASTTATYVSATPSVATVGASSGVITAVAAGTSIITATSGSLTTTTRVVVQAATPIVPHFGYDGTILTSYNPAKSIFVRSIFGTGSSVQQDSGLPPALAAGGSNTYEEDIYVGPYEQSITDYPTWQIFQRDVVNNPVLTGLIATGFKSIIGVCTAMTRNGGDLQSNQDGSFATRINYMMSALAGKIISCEMLDESYIPVLRVPGAGVIGAANGPTQVVVIGGTATVSWPGFTGTEFPIDITSSTNACLNKTNFSPNGTTSFTYSTACANGTYKPSGGTVTETGFTIKIFNEIPPCDGVNGCQNLAPLNAAVTNAVETDLHTVLAAATQPLKIAWPLQGSATTPSYVINNGVVDGFRVADYASVYWDFDGPESGRLAMQQSPAVRQDLMCMETHFWGQAWPGIEQARPFYMLIQTSGSWFSVGGNSFTLGATSGSQFTTTVANGAAAGRKIRVSGSSCNGNYDIASVQSSTQFTVSQSPGCSGSGGTVLIATGLGYYSPPVDILRSNGQGNRGTNIAAMVWDAIALGAAGARAFSYDATPSVRIGTPDTFANNYVGNSSDSGQTGVGYIANNPSASDRWNGLSLAYKLTAALEPYILQPVVSAPHLGSRIHTGARSGSAGTLVIAINDSEAPEASTFTFGAFNPGTSPVARFRITNGSFITTGLLAANSTSDAVIFAPGEVVVWFFPATAPVPALNHQFQFLPSSIATGAKVSLRYSYLSNNLDLQSIAIDCSSGCSVPLSRGINSRVWYDYRYLDSSNKVLSISNVQSIVN